MVDVVKYKISGLLEHPQAPGPDKRCAASIWKLDEMQWLMGASATCKIDFKQGRYGQISAKPTTFLSIRLPSLGRYLQNPPWAVHRPEEYQMLGGWDSNTNSWRTNRAKEYPPSLCRAVVTSLVEQIKSIHGRTPPYGNDDLEDVKHMRYDFDPYDENSIEQHHCIGADFMGFNKQ